MSIFNRKNKENTGIVEHVKSSFDRVKGEVQSIVEWLYFFHQKHQEHDIRLKLLENQISYMPKSPEDIRRIIDQYYSQEQVIDKVKELHKKVDDILINHRPVIKRLQEVENSLYNANKLDDPMYSKVKEIHSRLEAIERKAIVTNQPSQRDFLREKIAERVAKNSKTYVKNVILSLIQKYGNITGLQLKEIIVDEQGLCSKSSFYRLLTEVERQNPVTLTWKGKEKHYIAPISQKNFH